MTQIETSKRVTRRVSRWALDEAAELSRKRHPARRTALTPLDIDIMGVLQKDARASIAKIATRLGVPESTVRHRFSRLVEQGILRFSATTHPLEMGYQIWAMMDIQTEMNQIRAVARRVAEAPQVYFVGLVTGSSNVHIAAIFRSNGELLDFIIDRLSRIPGVIRTSTSNVLEVIKSTVAFNIVNDSAVKTPHRDKPRRTRSGSPSDGRHEEQEARASSIRRDVSEKTNIQTGLP